MPFVFTNFGDGQLEDELAAGATSMVLSDASAFPTSLAAGEVFRCTLWDGDASKTPEIVEVTAVASETFTITRAQESTSDQTWSAGTKVRLTWTAESTFAADGVVGALNALASAAAGDMIYFSATNTAALLNNTATTGRDLLSATSAADVRSKSGLVIGTDVQAWDADLDTLAAIVTATTGRDLLTATSPADIRSKAGTIIGTDVQAWDAQLDTFAAIVPVVDGVPYFSATGAISLASSTATGRDLLSATSAADMRSKIGTATDATATVAGLLQKATATEVWTNAAGALAMTPDILDDVAVPQSLTVTGGSIAVDWDTGANFEVALTASTQELSLPTNGNPGEWIFITVSNAATTARTLTFASTYLGTAPTVDDVTSSQAYGVSIYCHTASQYVISESLFDMAGIS